MKTGGSMTASRTAQPFAYGPFRPGVNRRLALLGLVFCLGAILWWTPYAKSADRETVVAILGDSLTAGYGLPAHEAFPARLEAALRQQGRNVRVINAGVSGDTSAGGLARLDWTLGDRPDLLVVELGSNDALRALDPRQTEANLDAIITRAKASGSRVLLAGMLAPPNLGREYGDAFKAIYPRLAEKHDVPLYPFFLDGVAAEASLNQPDGMHPNAEGVKVMVERFMPMLTGVLDQMAAAGG